MSNRLLTTNEKTLFIEQLEAFYATHGRHDLPWRQPESDRTFDPYKILVSELMLQQTQVQRVIPKYGSFLQRFPSVDSLAHATLGDVLKEWQGLGYNRRAKFLWETAGIIHRLGSFPATKTGLVSLPGVGVNTAGAILTYAYNEPVAFIETNIRTVYIHHFFENQADVTDTEIIAVLTQTLFEDEGKEQPAKKSHLFAGAMGKTNRPSDYREFYWALMDYGSWLKTHVRNTSQSKHYTKQSKFEGSKRQIRGQVVRELAGQGMMYSQLADIIADKRLEAVLNELVLEGMLVKKYAKYSLY